MEELGASVVMSSYDIHHHNNHHHHPPPPAPPPAQNHMQPQPAQQRKKRVSSPDLIQLSDSDCNMPAQPLRESGYTIMQSEDGEYDEDDGEPSVGNNTASPSTTDTTVKRRPTLDEEDLLEEEEGFTPRRRKSRRERRGTSGSSDPALSSPGSVSSQDSVTPTNIAQAHNRETEQHHNWHRLVNDEHCELLATEEDSSDRHSSNEEDEDNLLQHAQDMCMDPPSLSSAVDGQQVPPPQPPNTSSTNDTNSLESNNSCDSIWRISEEQRSYYTQQFKRLQPDLNDVLPGQQAKTFFEKSKLSTHHLTKIWNLADVTQDGALSLTEFLVAMHLVVARRNSIPLPTSLPAPLLSVLLQSNNQHKSNIIKQPATAQRQQSQQQSYYQQESCSGDRAGNGSSSSGGSSVVGSIPPPSTAAPSLPPSESGVSLDKDASPSRAKEWTKFVDSPTSTVSSPGIKPVNFDFHKNAVDKDPLILHPVAVRVTPEPLRAEDGAPVNTSADTIDPSTSQSNTSGNGAPASLRASDSHKRALPRKPPLLGAGVNTSTALSCDSSQYGPASLPMGGLSSPVGLSSSGNSNGSVTKKDQHPPPPPPPRGGRSHMRSSSLDLNKFTSIAGVGRVCLREPPAVPPRASPGTQSPPNRRASGVSSSEVQQRGADIGSYRRGSKEESVAQQHRASNNSSTDQQPLRTSAFEVYRKPSAEGLPIEREGSGGVVPMSRASSGGTQRPAEDARPDDNRGETTTQGSGARLKDKKEVTASIKTTRDRNTILARLNNELNQELAEVIEERIALEMQLEQMKLFTN